MLNCSFCWTLGPSVPGLLGSGSLSGIHIYAYGIPAHVGTSSSWDPVPISHIPCPRDRKKGWLCSMDRRGTCKLNDCTANWHTLKIKCIAFVNYINNIRGRFGELWNAVDVAGSVCALRAESVLNNKPLQFSVATRTVRKFFELHMASSGVLLFFPLFIK